MAKGETLVATDAGNVVGIVTLAGTTATEGSPFYDRPDVASFGQFAAVLSGPWHRVDVDLTRGEAGG